MRGIKATLSTIIGVRLPKAMLAFAALGAALMALNGPAMASDGASKKGRETGLPIPRFVSLKAKAVNLRVGPGKKYAIEWHYKKRGLPVEVIQEFDRWRRVRDADGATGWVLHSLLSAKRTAVIAPWDRELAEDGTMISGELHAAHSKATNDARVRARLQAGLLVSIDNCENNWCQVLVKDHALWLPQEKLWGTYPGEPIDG